MLCDPGLQPLPALREADLRAESGEGAQPPRRRTVLLEKACSSVCPRRFRPPCLSRSGALRP